MKGVPARKLNDMSTWRHLRQANAALRAVALLGQLSRQLVYAISAHDILLGDALVQLVEEVIVLGLQIPVHELDDFLLKESAGKDHVVIAVLICGTSGKAKHSMRSSSA